MPLKKFSLPPDLVNGVGRYRSWMVVLSIPQERVKQMLPRQLELAPQDIAPPGKHPLLLMFGHQLNVSIHLGSTDLFDLDYLEFVLEVPYTQWKSTRAAYRGPLLFSPRLWLNKTFPLMLGRFYGFAKERANMALDQDRYLIAGWETNKPLISGHFKAIGDSGPTANFPLFEQALSRLFNQPLVGQTRLGPLPGPFVCSIFDWHFDRAKIQAVEATVNIAQPFVPGLPIGEYSTPGLDTDALGAFHLDTRWQLTEPMDCADVDRLRGFR